MQVQHTTIIPAGLGNLHRSSLEKTEPSVGMYSLYRITIFIQEMHNMPGIELGKHL